MCRTAVIDKKLLEEIDISRCDLPSIALSSLSDYDVLVLINHGKTLESGIAFGNIVSGKVTPARAVLQIERPSEEDGRVIIWETGPVNDAILEVAGLLSKRFGLEAERRKHEPVRCLRSGDKVTREVRGVRPGEPVLINGTFIGTATGQPVHITSKDGTICEVCGVSLKGSGLSRVANSDIERAMIKSGELRGMVNDPMVSDARTGTGHATVIDHCAFSSLDAISPDTVCAVTIGDDTTEIAGDVLARRGIRIIGITDGDRDCLLRNSVKTPGSVVIQVFGITDDEAGAEIGIRVSGMISRFEGFVKTVRCLLNERKISYIITQY